MGKSKQLVYDICYFDTFSEHKVVLSGGIPDLYEAIERWKLAEKELSSDPTLKPYILPRRVGNG